MSLSQRKNQKGVEILERLQKELVENSTEDIAKQIKVWVVKMATQTDRSNSISFTPHTLQMNDSPIDEQRIPRIVETIKQLIQRVEDFIDLENVDQKTIDLVANEFLSIYTRIENAFDEEATIDLSHQNGYIHKKGKRAYKFLNEFSQIFCENEPIYKIFPLSKSESFQALSKLNSYIMKYILIEQEGNKDENFPQIKLDLTMEKINMYLTIIQRLQDNLEVLIKTFQSHASALEVILINIQNGEMVPPFYEAVIDFSSAPEEQTSSISLSKNNALQFQDKGADHKKTFIKKDTNMEMIQESEEDIDEGDEDEENGAKVDNQNEEKKEDYLKMTNFEKLNSFQFLIEYLKPGAIPWDLQTIRSEGKIGSGGQGTVFRAFDPTKERQIALKFTNLPCNWENFKETYLQEIKIQSQMTFLKMENIIEVDNKIFIYQDKYGQQQMYLVSLMELGVGSLEDFIKICESEKKMISDQEIFNIFFDILQGLSGIHNLGYSHKDIKPQNVIYSIKDKNWKIADFGCIQLIHQQKDQSEKETPFLQECQVTGTPTYMSPELYSLYQQRQEVGHVNLIANDYYSLGITLLKLREMEKIERSKLSEKIMISKLAHDNLSFLICLLLDDDQVFRSQLTKETFHQLFADEYEKYKQNNSVSDYLESIFKYDENAQDNLNIMQKLECAKTYQNINLREKCLHYFDEIVTDPEFEKLDLFEKRNILNEQAQALSFFGDYDHAYEQQMKCLKISSDSFQGLRQNQLLISDIKFVGQILFNQGNYDLALQKYIQALSITREEQQNKKQYQIRSSSQLNTKKKQTVKEEISALKRKTLPSAPAEKSVFSRNKQIKENEILQSGNSQSQNAQSVLQSFNETCNSQDSYEKQSLSDQHGQSFSEIEGDSFIILKKRGESGLSQYFYENNFSSQSQDGKNLKENSKQNLNNDCGSQSKNDESNIIFTTSKGEGQFSEQNGKREEQQYISTRPDSVTSFFNNESLLTVSNNVKTSFQFDLNSEFNQKSSANNGEKMYKENISASNSLSKEGDVSSFLSSLSNHSKSFQSGASIIPTKNNDVQENINNFIGESSREKAASVSVSLCDTQLVLQTQNENLLSEKPKSNKEIALLAIDKENNITKDDIKGLSVQTQNDYAQIQTLIGQALNKLGHYDKALKYYEEALGTIEKNLGKNDTSVAFILDSMGECQLNNGKYKEAFRIFKRSYRIKRQEYGKDSVHLADTINSMGKVLEKLTLYEKSAQHYQKALKIYEQHYGKNHTKTAEILNNLGSVKRSEGDYKQAYKIFKEVLNIASNHYPSDHIELGKIYHDIGNVLRNQENLELSLEYFLKSKDVKLKHYGPNHVEVSNTCQYIGIIYRKMEKLELAQQYFELALGPMENHYGKEHIEVIKLVQEIAVLLQTRGLDLQAKEKLEFVMKNRIKEFGVNHIKTANTMQNVATVEMELGNYAKSLEYNLQVLEVRKETFGKDHLKVANSHTSVGQLYNLLGNYHLATQSLQEAFNIYLLDLDTNKQKIQAANLIKAKILFHTLQIRKAQELICNDIIPNLKLGSVNFASAQISLASIFSFQKFILYDPEIEQPNESEEGIINQEWLRGQEERIASKEQSIKLKNGVKEAVVNLENALTLYEKNFGCEHYLFAQILEQKALITLDTPLAQSALQIKLKRFEDTQIEVINSHEIMCSIEFFKEIENNTITQFRQSNEYNLLLEKLKALKELKTAFYSNNTNHLSLLSTNLLLFRVSREPTYENILSSMIDLAVSEYA